MVEPIDLNKYREEKEGKREATARYAQSLSSQTPGIAKDSSDIPMKVVEEERGGKAVRVQEPDLVAVAKRWESNASRPRKYEDEVREQQARERASEIIDAFPGHIASMDKKVNSALNETIQQYYVVYKGRVAGDAMRARSIRNRQIDDVLSGNMEPERLFASALLILGKDGLIRAQKRMPGFNIDLDDDIDTWGERNRNSEKK